jgi:hypothetical protein
MDYMGILREAWDVTRRNKRLWILGLFAAGSAGVSSGNWNSSSSSSKGSGGTPAWLENAHSPNEALQRGLDEAGKQLGAPMGTPEQWWVFLAFAVLTLIVVCTVLWAIGIAARGGLIAQTREAVAGRPTSAGAGWRSGLHYWGRVFAVGFLFGLPLFGLGILGLIAFAGFGGIALIAQGNAAGLTAGLAGMGVSLSIIGLAAIAVGLITSMLTEVALRHAVLGGQGAIDSIKAAWTDLRAKRGVASMWFVMILVNIAAGIAAGILFVPVVLVSVAVVGGAVYAGGWSMLWLAAPFVLILMLMGMTLKAVYSTFRNTAWTSFFGRIARPELPPETPVVPASPVATA